MSVLIKGMEMPKDGEAVVLVISNENGNTLAEVDEYCGAVYEAVFVPPHGRLIDADALMLRVNMHGTNKFGMLDEDIRQFIEAAPTIIPAEEGE